MNKNWEQLKTMGIQKYYENSNPASDNLKKKRQDILDNIGDKYIASMKWDGEFAMIFRGEGDDIFIRSREKNTKGVFENKAFKIPHIVEEVKSWPEYTVVLAELCWPELGKVSTDVGTVMRCKTAEKALERQKDNKLVLRVFDILGCDNISFLDKTYQERIDYLINVFGIDCNGFFIELTKFNGINCEYKHFTEFANEIIAAGGEGAVAQLRDSIYAPNKKPAWQSLKIKPVLENKELKIVALLDPTREYKGKELDSWQYFIDGEPVTKAFYNGWKMGVTVDYNGTLVDVASGLTDADREWLATVEAAIYIKEGRLYADIKAMMEGSNGGLRHPVINRIRIMDAEG